MIAESLISACFPRTEGKISTFLALYQHAHGGMGFSKSVNDFDYEDKSSAEFIDF